MRTLTPEAAHILVHTNPSGHPNFKGSRMASPQVEEGYTRIANELLDAINKTSLTDNDRRVFFAIIRNTYGYNSCQRDISMGDLSEDTGIMRQHINRSLRSLQSRNMITISRNGYKNTIGIQKNYADWIEKSERDVASPGYTINLLNVASPGYGVEPHQATEMYPAQATPIYRERKKERFKYKSEHLELATYLFEKIRQNNPNAKKPNLNTWAVTIERLERIDERPLPEIKEVIDWCQADEFWCSNILSATKLREKYDQLYMRMKKDASKRCLYGEARSRYQDDKLNKCGCKDCREYMARRREYEKGR